MGNSCSPLLLHQGIVEHLPVREGVGLSSIVVLNIGVRAAAVVLHIAADNFLDIFVVVVGMGVVVAVVVERLPIHNLYPGSD